MPDLPNRSREENRLAAQLTTLFDQYRASAIDLLGDPPHLARIPEYFWQEVQNEIIQVIQPTLQRVHAESAARMAESVGLYQDDVEESMLLALVWSQQRASTLSVDLVTRIRTSLAQAIDQSDHKLALLLPFLAVAFGASRARRISVTELTGAVSAGELDQRNALQAVLTPVAAAPSSTITVGTTTIQWPLPTTVRQGRPEEALDAFPADTPVIVGIWNTAEDDRVCPICAPLNGSEDDLSQAVGRTWVREFPSGPPAHVNCRCWLSYVIAN